MTLGGCAALLGGFGAVLARQYMNPDGVSYMDLGDALLRRDWQMAANGYWSPLYALLLGVANRVLHPGLEWEFPVVHVVNLSIYLVTMASFAYFWQALAPRGLGGSASGVRRAAWPLLGYALFLWSTLLLIEINDVSPDLLLAGVIFLR
jgi:hypothetical protein